MKTKDGILKLNKTDVKEIKLLLRHTIEDISYDGGGTFNKGDNDNTFDEKEAKKAISAIESIKWILERFK